jgi:hypothetical protein
MKKKNIFTIQGLLTIFFLSVSLLVNTAYATTSWGFKDSKTGTGFSGYAQQSDCQTALATAKQTFPTSTFTDCAQATDAVLNYIPPASTPPILITPNTNPPASGSVVTSVYNLLAPIGNVTSIQTSGGTCPGNPNLSNGVGCYLNWIFKLGIGLCTALAVVMIIIASIQYMGTESVWGKTEARSKILQSILGLVLAMGSYAILNTISPDLLGSNGVQINQVTADIGGDSNAPIGGINVLPTGIVCSGGKANIPNIAASFNGKMTYSQAIPKGQAGPNSTIQLDCSGFANYVLECAGALFTNSGSADIFRNAEKVNQSTMTDTSVNGKALQVGDLIGWTPSDDPRGNGHVMIYVGNGVVNDSHGPAGVAGQAYGSFATTKYKSRITYIKRAS